MEAAAAVPPLASIGEMQVAPLNEPADLMTPMKESPS
jgi:hypothetical protein